MKQCLKGIGAQGDMGRFAASLKVQGRRSLRLDMQVARCLRRSLHRVMAMHTGGQETLRRMKLDAGRIEACLNSALSQDTVHLPAERSTPRMLLLARMLISGGENRLELKPMLADISAFDRVQNLQMQEIQALPAALTIALCEAFCVLARRLLEGDAACRAAEAWVRRGGRGRIRSACRDDFLEHGLRLASELERAQVHARLEGIIAQRGDAPKLLLERVHRSSADHCLQLDNLMHALHMLSSTDWEECFERLSLADLELNCDPAQLYGRMHPESKGQVRAETAYLARCFGVQELVLVRYALRLARKAQMQFGNEDPRATVCWYILEDTGREALRCELDAKQSPRLRIPDATGRKTVIGVTFLVLVLQAILVWGVGNFWMALCTLPLVWVSAMNIISRFYPRWVKPRNLPMLELRLLPDSARTLVVLPVLLSSVQRVDEMIARMEELGCLERDKNIDFLLLGDFRDADSDILADDGVILNAAREGIAQLNGACEREKYFYLQRMRSYRERDGRWMGKNRKRGALMALNALLLDQAGASEQFGEDAQSAQKLAGRYRYVVTLDADTAYLPGTLQKLVGIMLHPLNRRCEIGGRKRGYGVLQPAMHLMAEASDNAYVRLMEGDGGVDSYPVSISEFFQDVTGQGCFAGKGIYDVQSFAHSTEGVLRDDEILSHDLIEGILAGAGFVNDVHFYDGCPASADAELMRRHRWMRGDWQLLPVVFSSLRISALDRMKMLGNLLRSLYAPALAVLLLLSVWMDKPIAFSFGLVLAFQEALLQPLRGGKRVWKRALFRLALLPAEAFCAVDAILRTLWRLSVSRRHLMDWVTAADASGRGEWVNVAGRIAALLALPGLVNSFWIPAVLALAALFFVGGAWARDLADAGADEREALSADQREQLHELAGRTWSFFESCVPEEGCGLPPDNLQMDPPVGAAPRTSPTNIGLYLMSCFAARKLGFLETKDMLERMERTVQSLEKMEKWNGQLYNWYDIRDLRPLRPRYVSAVDSGNLAAALLLCARVTRTEHAKLAGRFQALAQNMNLAALYDDGRKLFRIGMDVENNRVSQAHYDLYASESRILSYAAMMLGQVPVEHWRHLSRVAVRVGRNQALLSWSGTMFEYLMPELLLRSRANTLAGQSCRGAVACQMEYGRSLSRPWGISESGYHGFDLQLNYQYRAFGLRSLALSGNTAQDVVAPYASALALCVAPAKAARNMLRMCKLGWSGKYGLYEAADYMHLDAGCRPRVVMSHMAHHQGMALCALANALRDDVLSNSFMEIPQARALSLLLQEKPCAKMRVRRESRQLQLVSLREHVKNYRRGARREGCAVDGHLLCGAGTSALVTARGAVHVWRDELSITRFPGDLQSRSEGMYIHLKDLKSGESTVMGQEGSGSFDAGSACFHQDFCGLQAQLQLCISPEDGNLYQCLEISNPAGEESRVEITGCFSVALADKRDMRAHPVFQNLFVESRPAQEGVLILRRRQRDEEKHMPELVYLVSGGENPRRECRLEKLVGRSGCAGRAGGIAGEFGGSMLCTPNPCAAMRVDARIPGGEKIRLHFALMLCEAEETKDRIARAAMAETVERALQLARGHALAVLNHVGVDERRFQLLQRASVLLLDGHLRQGVRTNGLAALPAPRSALWRAGISGDFPILLVMLACADKLDDVREGIRMHAFYQNMGVKTELVVVLGGDGDYHQPLRNALSDLLACSHASNAIGMPGGVFVLEERHLDEESMRALKRFAALCASFSDENGLKACLDTLLLCKHGQYAPMQAEELHFAEELKFFNGYGGFRGSEYVILLREGRLPPAPWCNVIASERAGAIVSERGGGFAWFGNSRSGRLTPFANDALREGWGWMFYLLDERNERWLRLLPGDAPMTQFCVRHAPGRSRWDGRADGIAFSVEMQAHPQGVRFDVKLHNEGRLTRHLRLAGFVDWLMGVDYADQGALRAWSYPGACFASGAAEGIGCFASDDPRARAGCSRNVLLGNGDIMHPEGLDMLDVAEGGWTLHLPLCLRPEESRCCRFLLGCAEDIEAARRLAMDFRSGEALRRSRESWNEMLEKLRIETPDEAVNLLANGFLQAQVLNGRIRGRTGLYQPGGAYGFRDQLQDMLPMIYYEPERVRRHLLHCAGQQFEAGDVLHWWHEPRTGVRTRISDDLLFLPYVAAQYVLITGDAAVLGEYAPFLENIEIPQGREDVHAPMMQTRYEAPLHDHCMRAFRRAARFGEHGLCLMGSGDWNDGMNRVGAQGKGESVWLSQFLAVCAADYACIAPAAEDAQWLMDLSKNMRDAVEKYGWDGKWYLRAYADDGSRLGSSDGSCCRIDAISQAWAVFAGLDETRCKSALNSAWEQLVDEENGIIRLLTPPFDGADFDPGYIAAYPAGIRENGAQYTHAACWLMIALIQTGDAHRAHRALELLLPVNHAADRMHADIYRVEPYVMAADIYTEGELTGRGGWTWYTGSAAWMMLGILRLLGFERRGNRVCMHALLGEWQEACITLHHGMSSYRLICRKGVERVELDGEEKPEAFINLLDDGRNHVALFPPRREKE